MRCISTLSASAIALCAGVLALSGCKPKAEPPPPPPPVEVEVIDLVPRSVPLVESWVASTEGMVNAKVRAQVAGYLVRQLYKEGSLVAKGDVLFEIDDRPFRAALDQAKGDLAKSQAQLAKATLDVDRYTPLAAESAISQQELDDGFGRG
jgi:membrane fusion protein (multidrug efflux system)